MMLAFVFGLVFIMLLIHRARRKATLHGLNGERPVFHVDPPTRRMGDRRRELL